jgi:predicted amidophosphoribosyltransferase
MRNRHIPRVCRNCHAPMASGADACWRCGVEWATEAQPPATLRLVPAVQPEEHSSPAPALPATVHAVAAVAAERR